ncbi:MAG TPA: sigma-70 family RNA polymerase sigma factor [Bacillales bacterium]|nr:sigma-70 family RNA polymerase sigma factor [Bacillales bacterium]
MDDLKQSRFQSVLQSYQADLEKYCRMLAGTPWDGDDLLQETLIKAFKSSTSLENHPVPKAFLFRVATHAWIDHCRRNKLKVDTYERMDRFGSLDSSMDFEIRGAMEALVHRLPPRQVVVILLIDVFGFSASSAAEMMEVTDGAVKALLHRARNTLKLAKDDEKREQDRLKTKSAAELIDLFLEAFHRFDPAAVIRVYHSLQEKGVEIKRVSGGGRLMFQFRDPDGNILTVTADS